MAQGGDISLPDVSKLNDLQDDQIEALIAKLAEVQTHAPQIIAALEAQQEARSRGSRSINSKDRPSSKQSRESPPNKNSKSKTKVTPPPQIQEAEEEDDDYDEDYDDFDEDAEYPMVGDGYSDELSVVSDMTTPTVVSSMEINEEEYYKDMVIGGMKVNAPKKKDMLSRVQQTNARKAAAASGGAPKKKPAAEPKKSSRASKPPSSGGGGEAPAPKKKSTKSKTAGATSPPTSGTKKVKKKVVKKSAAAANGEGSSSGAAPKKKAPQEQKPASGPVMIDDDGFLVDQSTFTSFDSSNNPFASAPAFTAGPDSGDGGDGFGDFGSFDFAPAPAPAAAAKKAPPRLKRIDGSKPSKKSGSGSLSGAPARIKKKSGSRRASVGAP